MNPLAPSPDQLRAMAAAAIDFIAQYHHSLPNRPVIRAASSAFLQTLLDEPLPELPTPFTPLLDTFRDTIAEYVRHNAHPRFFGYISSPGTPIAALAGLLADSLNANVTSWRSAPAAAELEHITTGWLKQMLGFPADALGVYTSGGSMANFAALAAARSARGPRDVSSSGLAGHAPLRIYASTQAHFSIAKAASMLGIGSANAVPVNTNAHHQLDLNHLEHLVKADRAAGLQPIAVVASAGTVATGAIDPLPELAAFARHHNLWFHIDAAYGGFAALAPSVKPLLQGIELADSVTLDPHKWAFLSTGTGCVLYRDPDAARRAFSHQADYTRIIGRGPAESFAFWDYSPELSRPFRALPLWFLFKFAGAQALGQAIENNIACARHLQSLIQASLHFEMLTPSSLSICCFRYNPTPTPPDLNALNEQILAQLQTEAPSYLSNAQINNHFALRACIVNPATTPNDIQTLLHHLQIIGDRRNVS